jgi:hypothetical protein
LGPYEWAGPYTPTTRTGPTVYCMGYQIDTLIRGEATVQVL